jgi:hypothetical protein
VVYRKIESGEEFLWWEKLAMNVGKACPVCVEYMEKQVLKI